MITWRPIAEMPDELKDGRQVAVAFRYENGTCNPGPPHWLYTFGRWFDRGWFYDDDVSIHAIDHEPTHFAEINAP